MNFNPTPSTIMHIDLNSCFATIEQQANPLFRGKPLVVAAYVQKSGCILAASREAKKLGIKTGMRVGDGLEIYRKLIVLSPDPEKYRFVNHKLRDLLSQYSADLSVESIDEMVIAVEGLPVIKTAVEIKQRIRNEIGEWLTVSIGIAPNRYLAKVASGLHKPDGLDVISRENIEEVLGRLTLEDLCGIKAGNSNRLRCAGIMTPIAMYHASPKQLAVAFRSVVGFHWWQRLHGWEDAPFVRQLADYGGPQQKTFGQSYAFGKPFTSRENGLYQVLYQLVSKMGRRLRQDDYTASGISVSCLFTDFTHWGHGEKTTSALVVDQDFYRRMSQLLRQAPVAPVRILAVGCFHLTHHIYQQSLFEEERKKERIIKAIDSIHDRWGDGVITSGRVLGTKQHVLDRIAFGRVKELVV